MEFWSGLVLGAVVGVIADRVWDRVERKPRLRLTHGYFSNASGERGITYTVENFGARPLPPFELVLCHPDRGSLLLFRPQMLTEFLPAQHQDFECVLDSPSFDKGTLLHWLEHARGEPATTVLDGGYVLQLRVVMSDTSLYQSRVNGNAFARTLYRALREGKVGEETPQESLELRGDSSWFVHRWIRALKERRMVKRAIDAGGTQVMVVRRGR